MIKSRHHYPYELTMTLEFGLILQEHSDYYQNIFVASFIIVMSGMLTFFFKIMLEDDYLRVIFFLNLQKIGPGMVPHACNPSYVGGIGWQITV
jgi:hypothetical protein